MHGYFIAFSVTHRSLSYSTLIKPSDVLSDETGHITNRVHPCGSHFLTRREEDDLHRRVTTQCETCDTWLHNLPNVQEVLGTANYCRSRYIFTHRELPNIQEVPREYRHWSSVTNWVFTNLPDIREFLWKKSASEFGQLLGVGRLTEHLGGFSKVLTSEFGHLSGIGKTVEHTRSFTIGNFVISASLCIHSSHRFAELRRSTRNKKIF